jgi:hypothetical protein
LLTVRVSACIWFNWSRNTLIGLCLLCRKPCPILHNSKNGLFLVATCNLARVASASAMADNTWLISCYWQRYPLLVYVSVPTGPVSG